MTPEELDELKFEISLLSKCRSVTAEAVVVGYHGIIATRGMARGLLLPQVATEQGWDRDTMLSNLSRKAGLSSDAWRRGGLRLRRWR